jgi:hypothetical protein
LSTKNLARTAIEGGRDSRNKWDRRQSNSALRAAERQYEAALRDPDARWSAVPPAREKVYPWFNDRLGPVYRWLDRRCGRPWAEVRSEILRRFDTRTLAGRHIVFDHMLRDVLEHGEPARYVWQRYQVDEDGVLRRVPFARRTRPRTWLTAAEETELRSLAGDRKIRQLGAVDFWLEMTYRYQWTKGRAIERQPTGRYRQTRRLTESEVKRLYALGPAARAILVVDTAARDRGGGGQDRAR